MLMDLLMLKLISSETKMARIIICVHCLIYCQPKNARSAQVDSKEKKTFLNYDTCLDEELTQKTSIPKHFGFID